MQRRIQKALTQDFGKKIQLLSGPRQVGKTTLSQLITSDYQYLNFDRAEHRQLILEAAWDRKRKLIIFDELHKMSRWKQWLKGIYDTEKSGPSLFVTGSARLDTYRKVGDSLAGRYFQYRLNPLTLNELKSVGENFQAQESFKRLMDCSGFPEPYLDGSSIFYQRWRATHLDIILRQDLVDLETVSSIQGIEQLIYLLAQQVGSTVSYSSLARTLQVSDKTIKRWLGILESLFVLFRVTPYAHKQSQVISKSPKFYFYDIARVEGSEGARFENLVALALQSELDFMKDSFGKDLTLQFLRKKDGREIDFVIADRSRVHALIECKWRDGARSSNFGLAQEVATKSVLMVQLVAELDQEKTFVDGCEIRSAPEWLSQLQGMTTFFKTELP
jgi:predicted AAA+ superfamily ATPase